MNNYFKNFSTELKLRSTYVFYIFIYFLFNSFNMLEYFMNFFIFSYEINLNEMENFYYKNLNFNNLVYLNYIEYDWYVNYNIFFLYSNFIIVKYYWILLILFSPYMLYEIYLFIMPSLYKHEIVNINSIIAYNITLCTIYIILFKYNYFINFLFLNEDIYTYMYNEWFDIFTNTNSIYKIYIFYFCTNTLLAQSIFIFYKNINYFKNKLSDYKKLRKFMYMYSFTICYITYNFIIIENVMLLEYFIYLVLFIELNILLLITKLY